MLDIIRHPIQHHLESYADCFSQALVTSNPLLDAVLSHVARSQGKMMRPALVLLCALEAGAVTAEALHAAVGLELLHTASLLHDDVLDESDQRRGQASVNALWGNKTAVLVGDFLTSKALQEVSVSGNVRLMERTGWLGQQLADGELEQMDITRDRGFSEARYYSMITKKTASLFETCARTGTLLAGGGEELVGRMGQFGRSVGICFQMRDDLLDYDNQHDTGKPSGNDMKEGKLTLPVIYALISTDNEAMKSVALKVRRGEATDEEIDCLIDFTHRHGGIAYTEKKIDQTASEALTLIPNGVGERSVTDALSLYVNFVAGRSL